MSPPTFEIVGKPHQFIGAIPKFAAHVAVQIAFPVPPKDWPALKVASLLVAAQMARAAGGGVLESAIAAVEVGANDGNPLTAWVEALALAHGLLDFRCVEQDLGGGAFRLRIFMAYPSAAPRLVRLALDLLTIAAEARDQGRARFDAKALETRLTKLAAELPAPDVRRLHAALTAHRVPWSWRGGEDTAVGWGNRRRLARGTTQDPDQAARALAAAELRIPVYTVTGSVGKTTTVRLLEQLFLAAGRQVGVTASDGMWVGGRQVETGDRIGAGPAMRLLEHSSADVAVFEYGRGALIKAGMAPDRTDVAVLLNVEDVHLGLDGIVTLEDMAQVKGMTLPPARLAILNLDDANCRRLGDRRDPGSLIWFSMTESPDALEHLAREVAGTAGVERDARGEAVAILLWREGLAKRLPLEGVAPFHGMLGEKTVEELTAVAAAAFFGPVRVMPLEKFLPKLRLDSENHRFRASVHRRGNAVFVLDKAAEGAALAVLLPAIETLCASEKITHRICALTRSAGEPLVHHLQSCAWLHPHFDEFVCFDRAATYETAHALPVYERGSIPGLLRDDLDRLSKEAGVKKPVHLFGDWDDAALWLRDRLAALPGPTLVLINQPSTGVIELSQRIVAFVDAQEEPAATS